MSDDKRPLQEQAEREIDPRDFPESERLDPKVLDIDTSRLMEQALEQTRMAICVSDPTQPDCPIVMVNEAFVMLTGYARDEVVGRNCRFLQGEDTAPEAVERIRAAVAAEEVRVIDILNYRKDGSSFWNALHIGPIYDDAGRLTHFYGSQWDVTDLFREREQAALKSHVADELQHRIRNLFGIVRALVRLSARGHAEAGALAEELDDRLTALQRAQEAAIVHGDGLGGAADLHALVEHILRPYRTGALARMEVAGPSVALEANMVVSLGLVLHELATNALKHGSLGLEAGTVRVNWSREGHELCVEWTEDGGPPADADPRPIGTGTRIIDGVVMSLGGTITRDWEGGDLKAVLTLPI